MKLFFLMRSSLLRRNIFILPLFLVAFSSWAQTYISGTVFDQDEALVGTTILVFQDKEQIGGDVTNFEGHFKIAVNPGTYNIEIQYPGFQTQELIGFKAINDLDNQLGNVMMSNNDIVEGNLDFSLAFLEQDGITNNQVLRYYHFFVPMSKARLMIQNYLKTTF